MSLNVNTGEIDLFNSLAGTYTVTRNTSGGDCPNSETTAVTITALDNASFSHSEGSYSSCSNETATPTIIGEMGDTFTASLAELSIDPVIGKISPSLSLPGVYDITYTSAGNCPNSATTTVTITESQTFDDGDFTYEISCATGIVTITGRVPGNTDTEIIIPDTASDGTTTYDVTAIGNNAFLDNQLTSVTISSNVTSIGNMAFGFADTSIAGEHNVTFLGDTPPTTETDSFVDASQSPNRNNITVTVTASALETYINDLNYISFFSIVPNTLNTQENSLENNISVFPNPAQGQIQLAYAGSQALNSITITDLLGKREQEVTLNEFTGTQTIDVSRLQTGLYFFTIAGNQNTTTKRVVIK